MGILTKWLKNGLGINHEKVTTPDPPDSVYIWIYDKYYKKWYVNRLYKSIEIMSEVEEKCQITR